MADDDWLGFDDDENELLFDLAAGDFYETVYLAVVLHTMRRRRAASERPEPGHLTKRRRQKVELRRAIEERLARARQRAREDPVLAAILEYAT